MNLIDVHAGNVEKTGFFCMMSKKKSEGYQNKLAWLRARFAEGLRIKMLDLAAGGRGFIEYIPGEVAWRPVFAADYMFLPSLPHDWDERSGRYGAGLTVVYADQCPYIPDATRGVLEAAEARGIEGRAVVLTSSREVRESAPSPYGVFQILYNGRLLSYHYLLRKDLERRPDQAEQGSDS